MKRSITQYQEAPKMSEQPLPAGWKVRKLKDLFDSQALNRLKAILNKKDMEALDVFLQEHRDELMAKEVLPKFLYYWLCYTFQLERKT